MAHEISFLDIWVKQLEQEVTTPDCEQEPRAIESDNWILCRWTAEEVKRLFSAILVGANLIYPEHRHEVFLSFAKQWDCPMDLCEQIAICIQQAVGTGNDLDIALQQYLNDYGLDNPTSGVDDDMMQGVGCDYDTLFAMCRQLVQLFNRMIEDVYERIEAATNNLEAVQAATDLVPGWSQSLDMVDLIIEILSESYLSTYDVELENEYACDLWCLAISNGCVLSLHDMADYFSGRVDESEAPETFADLVEWVLEGNYVGDDVCHVSFAIMCAVLYFGGKFVSLTLTELNGLLAALSNDEDADWQSLCDECAPWHATFDLTTDMSMFTIDVGQWVVSEGIHTENDPDAEPEAEDFRFDYTWDTATHIFRAKCTITEHTPGTWEGSTALWAIVAVGDFESELATRAEMVTQGTGDFQSDVSMDIAPGSGQALYVRVARHNMDGHALCSALELWGNGDPGAQFISDATTFEWLS